MSISSGINDVPFSVGVDSVVLEPELTFPGEVLEGDPRMTIGEIWESADRTQWRGIWQVEPGKFTWTFPGDEFFVVTSGHATVERENGEPLELVAGMVAIFNPGDVTTWTVHETLRKALHLGGLPETA
ncbi:cupin domain-containing protein [Lysinibacter sp. HNR]|uniref:cupin domain-containing protein n=1 Tax=Lysinibacter sp. HNR TaxID=3031408 RepID=UPI0024360383|nr:cupin domain-containing protein [Lysinibacter sp. HNR]WGD37614.1 cupin domain-containing protein [Lysinibacter sp. HNR]